MTQCAALNSTAGITGHRIGAVCFLPVVTQCSALDSTADITGLGINAVCFLPVVTQCSALDSTADITGLGINAVCFLPVVTQCAAAGETTGGAGHRIGAGCFLPVVTQLCALDSTADITGLGINAVCFLPVVTQCAAAGGSAGHAGHGIGAGCLSPAVTIGVFYIAQCDRAISICLQGEDQMLIAGNIEFIRIDAGGVVVQGCGSHIRTQPAIGHIPNGIAFALYSNITILRKGSRELTIFKLVNAHVLSVILAAVIRAIDVAEEIVAGACNTGGTGTGSLNACQSTSGRTERICDAERYAGAGGNAVQNLELNVDDQITIVDQTGIRFPGLGIAVLFYIQEPAFIDTIGGIVGTNLLVTGHRDLHAVDRHGVHRLDGHERIHSRTAFGDHARNKTLIEVQGKFYRIDFLFEIVCGDDHINDRAVAGIGVCGHVQSKGIFGHDGAAGAYNTGGIGTNGIHTDQSASGRAKRIGDAERYAGTGGNAVQNFELNGDDQITIVDQTGVRFPGLGIGILQQIHEPALIASVGRIIAANLLITGRSDLHAADRHGVHGRDGHERIHCRTVFGDHACNKTLIEVQSEFYRIDFLFEIVRGDDHINDRAVAGIGVCGHVQGKGTVGHGGAAGGSTGADLTGGSISSTGNTVQCLVGTDNAARNHGEGQQVTRCYTVKNLERNGDDQIAIVGQSVVRLAFLGKGILKQIKETAFIDTVGFVVVADLLVTGGRNLHAGGHQCVHGHDGHESIHSGTAFRDDAFQLGFVKIQKEFHRTKGLPDVVERDNHIDHIACLGCGWGFNVKGELIGGCRCRHYAK